MKIKNDRGRTVIFLDSEGNKFELGYSALISMNKFVQDAASKVEAGGVLLGRYIVNCKHVVVDSVTVPLENDKRSRFLFFRTAKRHQSIIDNIWLSSDGTCNYLGEWHTHPEPDPVPSPHDISEWRRKLHADKFDSDFLFFVIVGTEKINAWRGSRDSGTLEKLELIH